MAEIFLDDDRWNALAAALANLQPCPVYGRITPDQVKVALGEYGGVWPASIASPDTLKLWSAA